MSRLLGPADEPRDPAAVVAVHYGDYRKQEIWVSSGADIGTWYCLGGEFGRGPKVWDDPRNSLEKLIEPRPPKRPEGTVPQRPHWEDVLARGPVTLLVGADDESYRRGWRRGREYLAEQVGEKMEWLADEDPPESQ